MFSSLFQFPSTNTRVCNLFVSCSLLTQLLNIQKICTFPQKLHLLFSTAASRQMFTSLFSACPTLHATQTRTAIVLMPNDRIYIYIDYTAKYLLKTEILHRENDIYCLPRLIRSVSEGVECVHCWAHNASMRRRRSDSTHAGDRRCISTTQCVCVDSKNVNGEILLPGTDEEKTDTAYDFFCALKLTHTCVDEHEDAGK